MNKKGYVIQPLGKGRAQDVLIWATADATPGEVPVDYDRGHVPNLAEFSRRIKENVLPKIEEEAHLLNLAQPYRRKGAMSTYI